MKIKLTHSIGLFFSALELFAKDNFGKGNFKLMSLTKTRDGNVLVGFKTNNKMKTVVFDRDTEEFNVIEEE